MYVSSCNYLIRKYTWLKLPSVSEVRAQVSNGHKQKITVCLDPQQVPSFHAEAFWFSLFVPGRITYAQRTYVCRIGCLGRLNHLLGPHGDVEIHICRTLESSQVPFRLLLRCLPWASGAKACLEVS